MQKLIIISGSPWVGKSTVAESLFCSYENSAHLDDDWVWHVHPFSFDDPRNKYINKNMSFVLSTYLSLNFDYVVLSSVRMISQATRDIVIKDITAENYITIGFTLTCSEATLMERYKNRGDQGEISFQWLRRQPVLNDYVINTDHKTVEQIVSEMKSIIDHFEDEAVGK